MIPYFNIIIVEADVKISLQLELVLKRLGHKVIESLDKPYDILLALEDHTPDLIIMNTNSVEDSKLSPFIYYIRNKGIHLIINNSARINHQESNTYKGGLLQTNFPWDYSILNNWIAQLDHEVV